MLRYGDDLTRGGGVLWDPTIAVTPAFLAAETNKVRGVEVFNSPYGPQLDTVYMVK